MEARVWVGTKGRFNPMQRFEEWTLCLDRETLTFRDRNGLTMSTALSKARLSFPFSMSGAGFVLELRGVRAYVWFYDPFAGRGALLESGDLDEARLEGARSWFQGRRAAKPWLRALRAAA
jgi:hypothetical protein